MSNRYFHFARKGSMGSKSLTANLTDVGTYSLSALCAVSLNHLFSEERERLVKILYLVYPWFYFSTIITAKTCIPIRVYVLTNLLIKQIDIGNFSLHLYIFSGRWRKHLMMKTTLNLECCIFFSCACTMYFNLLYSASFYYNFFVN